MNKAGFEELKPILKDKWLDYYEANRKIIDKLMDSGYQSNSYNDGFRPTSEFIIGTMISLKPEIAESLSYFLLVCTQLDTIVEVLGLNFNPSIALEERKKQNCTHEQHDLAVSEVA